MRLEQVMSRNPISVHPDDKVADAARTMRDGRVSAALVVEGDALVGILTERDLAHKLVAEGLSAEGVLVRDLMTPDPITASPQTTTWDALGTLTVRGIRHLPVVRDGIPVGIVSLRDLTAGDAGQVETLLEGLDQATRARLASILVWAIDRVGLRREDFLALTPPED